MPIQRVSFDMNIEVDEQDKKCMAKVEDIAVDACRLHNAFLNVTARSSILNEDAIERMQEQLKRGSVCFTAPCCTQWGNNNPAGKQQNSGNDKDNDDKSVKVECDSHAASDSSAHESMSGCLDDGNKENVNVHVNMNGCVSAEHQNSEECDRVSSGGVSDEVSVATPSPSYYAIPDTNPPIYVASNPMLHEVLMKEERQQRQDRVRNVEGELLAAGVYNVGRSRRTRSRNVRYVDSYNENNLQNQNMIHSSASIAGVVKKAGKRYRLGGRGGEMNTINNKKMHLSNRSATSDWESVSETESCTSPSPPARTAYSLPAARQKTALLLAKKRQEREQAVRKEREMEKAAAIHIANELISWMDELIATEQANTAEQEGETGNGNMKLKEPQNVVEGTNKVSEPIEGNRSDGYGGGDEGTNIVSSGSNIYGGEHDYLMPTSPSNSSIESLSSWFDSDSCPSASSSPLPSDDTQYNSPVFTFHPVNHSDMATTLFHHQNGSKHSHMLFNGMMLGNSVYYGACDSKHDSDVGTNIGTGHHYNDAPVFSF